MHIPRIASMHSTGSTLSDLVEEGRRRYGGGAALEGGSGSRGRWGSGGRAGRSEVPLWRSAKGGEVLRGSLPAALSPKAETAVRRRRVSQVLPRVVGALVPHRPSRQDQAWVCHLGWAGRCWLLCQQRPQALSWRSAAARSAAMRAHQRPFPHGLTSVSPLGLRRVWAGLHWR